MTTEPRWLQLARDEVGVREIRGRRSNPAILGYAQDAKIDWYKNDDTAWCAVFVSAMLERSGLKSRKTAWARAYGSWGKKLRKPKKGCVAVFTRGKTYGHVGFYVGERDGKVLVLGGNQSNEVNVSAYPKWRLISYRWPNEDDYYPEADDADVRDEVEEESVVDTEQEDGEIVDSTEREETFDESENRLRNDGSRIVKGSDEVEKTATRGLFGAVLVWIGEKINAAFNSPGEIKEWISFAGEWALVIVIGLAALYIIDRIRRVRAARVEDDRSGKTARRTQWHSNSPVKSWMERLV